MINETIITTAIIAGAGLGGQWLISNKAVSNILAEFSVRLAHVEEAVAPVPDINREIGVLAEAQRNCEKDRTQIKEHCAARKKECMTMFGQGR